MSQNCRVIAFELNPSEAVDVMIQDPKMRRNRLTNDNRVPHQCLPSAVADDMPSCIVAARWQRSASGCGSDAQTGRLNQGSGPAASQTDIKPELFSHVPSAP